MQIMSLKTVVCKKFFFGHFFDFVSAQWEEIFLSPRKLEKKKQIYINLNFFKIKKKVFSF
jgi:hypothetical protein